MALSGKGRQMTIYITQGRYTREAITGMINKPEDRAIAVAALAEAAGGKLLDYYVTFGEYDFLVVMESNKKETDVMASLFAAASAGGVTDLTTTVGVDLLPITVMLNSDTPDHLVRSWTPPGSDENRHLGYAFQWFALAVTVVVVTVVVTLRSRNPGMT